MKRWSEVATLILPAALLAAVGLLQGRGQGPRTTDERFRITVNRVEFLREKGYWDYRKKVLVQDLTKDVLTAYVFVEAVGRAPAWWLNEKRVRPRMQVRNIVIADKNGNAFKPRYIQAGSGRGSEGRYNISVFSFVPKARSAVVAGTFTATAYIGGAGFVRFSAPIHMTNVNRLNVFSPKTTPGVVIIKH